MSFFHSRNSTIAGGCWYSFHSHVSSLLFSFWLDPSVSTLTSQQAQWIYCERCDGSPSRGRWTEGPSSSRCIRCVDGGRRRPAAFWWTKRARSCSAIYQPGSIFCHTFVFVLFLKCPNQVFRLAKVPLESCWMYTASIPLWRRAWLILPDTTMSLDMSSAWTIVP